MAADLRLRTVLQHLIGSREDEGEDFGENVQRSSEGTDCRSAVQHEVGATHSRQQIHPSPSGSHILQCAQITPDVGAEVVGAALHEAPTSPELVAAVDAALVKHKVLVFRDQRHMDSEKQLALVRALNIHWGLGAQSPQQKQSYENGAFVIRMLPSKPGTHSTIWPVESSGTSTETESPLNPADALSGAAADAIVPHRWRYHQILARAPPLGSAGPMARFALAYGGTGNWTRRGHEATRATNVWHSDDNYVLEPPWISILRSLKVPPCGGDTLFADMALAMADLSSDTKAALRPLAAVADWRPVFPHYCPGTPAYDSLRALYPLVAHPLVRTHPVTGEEVLYCNSIYTVGLRNWSNGPCCLGPAPPSADQLLRELLTLPGIPEYQCRVRWQGPGDVLLWDNRRLQHYATSDYGGEARQMEHCASLGTVPYLSLSETSRMSSQLLPAGMELADLV